MQMMSEFVAFNGSPRTIPTPSVVATVLETVGVSVVVDLCEYPVSQRGQSVTDLLRLLRSFADENSARTGFCWKRHSTFWHQC